MPCSFAPLWTHRLEWSSLDQNHSPAEGTLPMSLGPAGLGSRFVERVSSLQVFQFGRLDFTGLVLSPPLGLELRSKQFCSK